MMLPRENTLAEHINEVQVAKENARAQSSLAHHERLLTKKAQEDADYWQDKFLTSVEMLGEAFAHMDPDIDLELYSRVESFLEES